MVIPRSGWRGGIAVSGCHPPNMRRASMGSGMHPVQCHSPSRPNTNTTTTATATTIAYCKPALNLSLGTGPGSSVVPWCSSVTSRDYRAISHPAAQHSTAYSSPHRAHRDNLIPPFRGPESEAGWRMIWPVFPRRPGSPPKPMRITRCFLP